MAEQVSGKANPNFVPKPRKRPHAVPLASIVAEEVHWLWYPYIPAGKVVLLEGDPGLGKSWISCALAADISQGKALPGQKKALPPQRVLMLSAEDGLGDTVRPRIESIGGNLDMIHVSDDYFVLDEMGLKDMEHMMRETAATIVFLDPIVAYMGGKIDMHKANEVRALMGPLSEMAKRTGTAIVAVRHLRKAGGKNAKYRGIGSIDFTAAVRSVLQVEQSRGGTHFMSHVKHNLSPKGSAIAYVIEDGKFRWDGVFEDEEVEAPQVSSKTRTAGAKEFLFLTLRDGPLPAVDVIEKAALAGYKERTLQDAKKGLAHSERINNQWVWMLDDMVSAPLSLTPSQAAQTPHPVLAPLPTPTPTQTPGATDTRVAPQAVRESDEAEAELEAILAEARTRMAERDRLRNG